MSGYALRPNLSPKRRKWLEQLRDHGPAKRPKSNVGCHCMRLGWTEWFVRLNDGREMTTQEARILYPDGYWDRVDRSSELREVITEAGRAALRGEHAN